MYEIEPVANYHCITGENPLYNVRDGKLYWVDIESGRLFRVSHNTLEHECFYHGDRIGGFSFQEDGSLLLFEANRISRLDASGKHTVLIKDIDPDMARFNDVIADPEGRVYAGTIGRTNESGGLYRVERDGSIKSLFKGSGCSNGLGFTPDLKKLYWTCTTRRRIFIYDYDRATGELTNEKIFYQASPEEGFPDGMTVDVEGNVWTTRWDGFVMLKLSPKAEVLETVRFPVGKVSSCVFAGPEFDTLYVTTAGGKGPDGKEGAEGTLYRLRTGARGQVEFRSKVLLG